jgi:hypothetical protein
LAEDLNAQHFGLEDILHFFRDHSEELPNWGAFACALASQQVNSAAVERVFSMLKQAFNDTQSNSLSDYVNLVTMRRYNERGGQPAIDAFNSTVHCLALTEYLQFDSELAKQISQSTKKDSINIIWLLIYAGITHKSSPMC